MSDIIWFPSLIGIVIADLTIWRFDGVQENGQTRARARVMYLGIPKRSQEPKQKAHSNGKINKNWQKLTKIDKNQKINLNQPKQPQLQVFSSFYYSLNSITQDNPIHLIYRQLPTPSILLGRLWLICHLDQTQTN